jgi:hypothetical protein
VRPSAEVRGYNRADRLPRVRGAHSTLSPGFGAPIMPVLWRDLQDYSYTAG